MYTLTETPLGDAVFDVWHSAGAWIGHVLKVADLWYWENEKGSRSERSFDNASSAANNLATEMENFS